ncbi:hypothetical protein [Amycolatopsis sp. WAC 04169]|uniref:hypothetical protein n=1 Tax=Amycolatopsis sp. WAC 04169 TaxID=2203197 RepID=UPI001F1DDD76|nr:hypothetical protein [Amycolatopsis sp. WAC 04169]
MTIQPDNTKTPDNGPPQRVKVVIEHVEKPARRVATSAEMIRAARPLLRTPGRHRKVQSRDSWLCLAMAVLAGWAPTLRMCLLLTVGGAIVVGVVEISTPEVGVSAGTSVGLLTLFCAWIVKARQGKQRREPSL